MTLANYCMWSRRRWLTSQMVAMATGVIQPERLVRWGRNAAGWASASQYRPSSPLDRAARAAKQAEGLNFAPWQALAQQAVDAARTAGARYADARLTRIVHHRYGLSGHHLTGGAEGIPSFRAHDEEVGIGVRALVDGYWGFASSVAVTSDSAVQLARDAVAQAKENDKGPSWIIELGTIPIATGTWTPPRQMDPFTIPIEEKQDFFLYWKQCAAEARVDFDPIKSWFGFVRQERVVATSEGALFTQTIYESGGVFLCIISDGHGGYLASRPVHGIDWAAAGWERFVAANAPDQFFSGRIQHELANQAAISSKAFTLGRYTLVCDGATMAAMLEATVGVATQLDRALGYEADALGTSFVTDPIAMVGQLPVAAPPVTVTGNRSIPTELATVKWDDEGVEPQPFTLIKDGVLVDFQTTREQAAWLAPYYQQHNLPVRSHGCAAAQDAHLITMQMMPNLSLEPSPAAVRLEDLVADVKDGILVEGGEVGQLDSQARTGLLGGRLRQITNGRLDKWLTGGVIQFESQDFWKHLQSVGGVSTQEVVGFSVFRDHVDWFALLSKGKGQPPQWTSHSIRAVAATIPNQPLIDPARKA